MKIAILGSGSAGSALAAKLLEAGHTLTFGVRSNKTGLPAPALPLVDAVNGAELIINATPGGASIDILQSIGAATLGNKILLDIANAIDDKLNLVYPNDSIARLVQAEFPELKVVKSLNTVNATVMTNPSVIEPTTVFLSGNDDSAKATVSGLLTDLGWSTENQFDLGDVTTARGPEAYFLLFIGTVMKLGSPLVNVAVKH
jgi:predicted dinucleotide-binding enzyme